MKHGYRYGFDAVCLAAFVNGYLRKNKKDLSKIRWTVDNQKDLDTVSNIFKHFSPNIHFSWLDVLKLNC